MCPMHGCCGWYHLVYGVEKIGSRPAPRSRAGRRGSGAAGPFFESGLPHVRFPAEKIRPVEHSTMGVSTDGFERMGLSSRQAPKRRCASCWAELRPRETVVPGGWRNTRWNSLEGTGVPSSEDTPHSPGDGRLGCPKMTVAQPTLLADSPTNWRQLGWRGHSPSRIAARIFLSC